MKDVEKLEEIIHFDIEKFGKGLDSLNKDKVDEINSIASSYSLDGSNHPEMLTLRNNLILLALGNNKDKDNLTLKAAILEMIFNNDEFIEGMLEDNCNADQIAYAFNTTPDNVEMYLMYKAKKEELEKNIVK